MISLLHLILVLATSEGATLQGTVRAEGSREPIANASVLIPQLRRSVMTDEHGVFVLPGVSEGRWEVRATALGYRTHSLTIVSAGRGIVRIDFELEREPVLLSPVHARTRAQSDSASVSELPPGPGPVQLSGAALKAVPALAEADVLRALQTLPSVAASSDYSSALYVRGGSPDQTLITLDGVPLFNPYHLGGVFAAFDPDAIASVDTYPGALPAHLGDRVSGVVAVNTRAGGRDRVRANGAVGLISTRASVDGPLGEKGSYLASARHTYIDLFTRAAYRARLTKVIVPYGFSDGHLKLTRSIGPLGSLTFSLYGDREGISIPERMRDEVDMDVGFAWGSLAGSVAFRQALGTNLLSEFRLGFSQFDGSFDATDLNDCGVDVQLPECTPKPVVDGGTTQRDVLGTADFTWYHTNHELRLGTSVDAYLFRHHAAVDDEDLAKLVPDFRLSNAPVSVAAYLQDDWRPFDALQLRAGVRAMHATTLGDALLPRFGVRANVTRNFSLSAGGGRYAQVMSTLRNEESFGATLVAYDLVAARPQFGFVKGEDVVVGAEWRPGGASIRVDAYAKRTSNVPMPTSYGDIVEAPVLVIDSVAPGRTTARGVELLARYAIGRTDLGLSYTLSSTENSVAGVTFPARYDRRHVIDLNITRSLGENSDASARMTLGTGQPYTRVAGATEPMPYDPNTGGFWPSYSGLRRAVLLGPHNSERLPGYFRVDAMVRKQVERHWFGRDMTLTPYVQVLNVFNNKNSLIGDPSVFNGTRLRHFPQMPILPTFGVEWKF